MLIAPKRLKLRTSDLTFMFPVTVRTWSFKYFLERGYGKGHMTPEIFKITRRRYALSRASSSMNCISWLWPILCFGIFISAKCGDLSEWRRWCFIGLCVFLFACVQRYEPVNQRVGALNTKWTSNLTDCNDSLDMTLDNFLERGLAMVTTFFANKMILLFVQLAVKICQNYIHYTQLRLLLYRERQVGNAVAIARAV